MAKSRMPGCISCKSTQHRSRDCASHTVLIDFDEPPRAHMSGPIVTSREDANGLSPLTQATLELNPWRSSKVAEFSNAEHEKHNLADAPANRPKASSGETFKESSPETKYNSVATKDDGNVLEDSLIDTSTGLVPFAPLPYTDITTSLRIPRLPEYQDQLSEDEADTDALKQESLGKVMTWDDGARKKHPQPKAKTSTLMAVREDSPDGPQAETVETMQTETKIIQPFKDRPLSGMIPTEELKRTGGDEYVSVSEASRAYDLTDGKVAVKTYVDAVTRTLNPERGTVAVSSLRRKRKGRGRQSTYYDITPELRYLRRGSHA